MQIAGLDSTQAANVALMAGDPEAPESGGLSGFLESVFGGSDLHPNSYPGGIATDRTLVASQDAVDTSDLDIQDAYDVRLYREAGGDYTAEIYMKLDFNFIEGADAGGQPLTWSDEDKQAFIAEYEQAIENVWDGQVVRTLDDGSEVRLDVNLDSRDALLVTGENWSVNVTRIEEGAFGRSSVSPGGKSANLDSEDVVLTPKGGGNEQTGAAHEFGHMIGLLDEYLAGSPHIEDSDSIMHGGQTVEPRHLATINEWVENNLP